MDGPPERMGSLRRDVIQWTSVKRLGVRPFKKPVYLFLVFTFLISGLLFVQVLERDENLSTRPGVEGVSSALTPFVFHWQANTEYTYGISFKVDGSLGMRKSKKINTQDDLLASLELKGELIFRSYGKLENEESYVLGARFKHLNKVEWALGNQPVTYEEGRSLVGPEVALIVGPLGDIRSINSGEEDAHALNLFRQVLAAMEVVVEPGEESWEKSQKNPVGDVRNTYDILESRPRGIILSRRPMDYSNLAVESALYMPGEMKGSVTGEFSIELDRIGHVKIVDGFEEIAVKNADNEQAFFQQMEITARLLSISQVESGLSASQRIKGLASTGMGDVTVSEDARRRSLEQRIRGLKMKRLVSDLLVHGPSPNFPEAGRWMRRATGLLLLSPELSWVLMEVFTDPRMNHRGRARVLDLLASTGHSEAQSVMREMLETQEARESDRFSMLLQRLSLVNDPTQETIEYLRTKVQNNDEDYVMAAAHSLGAAIGHQSEGDERSVALLRRGLEGANSTKERVAWLGALGNAGQNENVNLLIRQETDDDPRVRAAVADALRKTQTSESESALLALVADSNSDVQNRALHTLARYRLGPECLEILRQNVEDGLIDQTNIAMLMVVIENNRQLPDSVLLVVEELLHSGVSDRMMLLRLNELRESLLPSR